MRFKKAFIVFCVMACFPVLFLLTSPAAANISGAIFTSLGDGSGVNINLYDDKCDVFLNGGPPAGASCERGPAGLPDGCYVYQVTAPPGGGQTEALLSQDSIKKRFVKVFGGVFVHDDGQCAAAAAVLTDCGTPSITDDGCGDMPEGKVNNTGSGEAGHDAGKGKCWQTNSNNISVRLMPYADTPNNGGVYKVYATQIGVYDNNCGGVFGFIHSESKTDNFRVKTTQPPPPPQRGTIDVLKFCDANGNGIFDVAEFGLAGWQINFSPDPNSCSGMTDDAGLLGCTDLETGTYGVSETVQDGFAQTATCVDGFCGKCSTTTTEPCNLDLDCPTGETCTPNGPATASITIAGGDTHNVGFGNVGLGTISGRKFYDANANGVDDGEPGIAGVKINLTGAATLCAVTATDGSYSFTGLLPGVYTVTEVKPAGTIATTPLSCVDLSLEVDGESCAGETETCSFGNICLGAGGGKTLGFWSNANGQAVMNDGGSMEPELAMLRALNLRNAAGNNFDPTTYAQFRTWLLSANATNMAYMLSAQLAAMALNVEAVFVNSGALVYAPGCGNTGVGNNFISIGGLMTAANTSLGTNGTTVALSAVRTYQECLKNALDKANNNQNFVVPCQSNYGATCP